MLAVRRISHKLVRTITTVPDYDIHIKADCSSTLSDTGRSDEDAKLKLLSKSMDFIPEFGFTKQTFVQGSEALGWAPSAHGLCARGPIELVEHFINASTLQLQPTITTPEFQSLKTTAKIRRLVLERLAMTKPFIHHWPQAVALMARPKNSLNTARQLSELVDEIWFLAGDKSVDFNWYSKRALLAGVYVSTEMFMTSDLSVDYKDTEEFLDRRLRNVGTLGKTIGQFKQTWSYGSSQLCSIIKSKS